MQKTKMKNNFLELATIVNKMKVDLQSVTTCEN